MPMIDRRAMLAGAVALAMTPCAVAAHDRSHAATYGAAPFATEHLIPGAPLSLATVDRASPAARVIALTIDDGPDPRDPLILDVLQRHEAKATFFFIGAKIAAHRDIALAVAASGNEVGSHTQTHPMMTDLTPRQRERNLAKADAALAGVAVRPAWFRPPYGDFDDAVAAQAQAHGLQTVLWTADSQDWKGIGADAIASRIIERLEPGAVLLMHSTKAASLAALPAILEEGQRQGYRFVTMSDWWNAMRFAAP